MTKRVYTFIEEKKKRFFVVSIERSEKKIRLHEYIDIFGLINFSRVITRMPARSAPTSPTIFHHRSSWPRIFHSRHFPTIRGSPIFAKSQHRSPSPANFVEDIGTVDDEPSRMHRSNRVLDRSDRYIFEEIMDNNNMFE